MFERATRNTGFIALSVALVLLACALMTRPGHGVSKTVIYRLQAAARAQYPDAGDVMDRYTMYVYGGKEYATTRGVVKGVETVAVWEYVPNEWHRVFDYPITEARSPDVTQRYRSYGFTARMQNKMLARPKYFPGMHP